MQPEELRTGNVCAVQAPLKSSLPLKAISQKVFEHCPTAARRCEHNALRCYGPGEKEDEKNRDERT